MTTHHIIQIAHGSDTAEKVKTLFRLILRCVQKIHISKYYLFGDDMEAHTDPNYTRADQVVDTKEKMCIWWNALVLKSRYRKEYNTTNRYSC